MLSQQEPGAYGHPSYRYSPGTQPVLLDLGGLKKRPTSVGIGINSLGQVTGEATGPSYYARVIRYTDGGGFEELGNFFKSRYSMSRGMAINSSGQRVHELLQQDLAELKLRYIAESYREVLDEGARKNTPMLEVLASLIAGEVTFRRQKALERRIRQAKLPPRKTLEDYKFTFPKRIPKQQILRLFDCDFVAQHQCAVLIGATGIGKSHLLNALGYTACEKGISVRWTRAIDMINI